MVERKTNRGIGLGGQEERSRKPGKEPKGKRSAPGFGKGPQREIFMGGAGKWTTETGT